MFTLKIKIQDFKKPEIFERTLDKPAPLKLKQKSIVKEPIQFKNLYLKYRSKSTASEDTRSCMQNK